MISYSSLIWIAFLFNGSSVPVVVSTDDIMWCGVTWQVLDVERVAAKLNSSTSTSLPHLDGGDVSGRSQIYVESHPVIRTLYDHTGVGC